VPRKPVKSGLVSKNGIDFFPYEFIQMSKKTKKTEDDA
jgi:hypothetical protein